MKYFNSLLKITLLLFVILCSSTSYSSIRNNGFADLVEQLIPSVVSISTSQNVTRRQPNNFKNLFKDKNFNEYFRNLPDLLERFYGNPQLPEKAHSLGSGFIIDQDGYIVTNYHVVENSEEISVIFSDESVAKAEIIGTDAKTDIALLKVNIDKKLPYIKWGDSDRSRIGDWVIAIGNPFGLGSSVSSGIISARARNINIGRFDDFIQTDAAINRGNSGGPLFNIDGKVIGINSAIFSPSGGNVGVGFAVPSALSIPVIDQLKKYGETRRGWLGVKIQSVTKEIANNLGLSQQKGALIIDVINNSPAEIYGLLSGDIILSFNNKEISTMRMLPKIVAETEINSKVPIKIWRNNRIKNIIIKIAKLEESSSKISLNNHQDYYKKENTLKTLGIELSYMNDRIKKEYNIDKNTKGLVVIKLLNNSKNKLIPGDVIVSANQRKVSSFSDFKNIINKSKNSILLLIQRNNEKQFVIINKSK